MVDYSLKLEDYVDELKAKLTKIHNEVGENYKYYFEVNDIDADPLMNIYKLSIEIRNEMRLNIWKIPDINVESINKAIEEIAECCAVIKKTAISSVMSKQKCEKVISDASNLSSKLDKYIEEITYLTRIMEVNRNLEQL